VTIKTRKVQSKYSKYLSKWAS